MWKVFTLCIALSLGMVLWLSYEVGAIFPKHAEASEVTAEKKANNEPLSGVERSLEARSQALAQREEVLSKRERSLAEKEKILTTQLARYETIISDMKGKLTDAESAKNTRVESFRQVYEKMEPKKAAKILDEMDTALSSQILGGMRGEKAAAILSQLSPEKARQITERYLGKRTTTATKVNDVKPADNPEAVDSAASPTKGGVK